MNYVNGKLKICTPSHFGLAFPALLPHAPAFVYILKPVSFLLPLPMSRLYAASAIALILPFAGPNLFQRGKSLSASLSPPSGCCGYTKSGPLLRTASSIILYYFMILDTTPEPTVLPPSRIAKRSPSSIAIGAIRSISISMLSPGITISTPSGSLTTPVTSVVRK